MRSKLSAITARTPSSTVPLAAQSRELPVPYSLPAMTTSGRWSCLIVHRRVVDRHRLAGRRVAGEAALDVVEHAVADADVGEGAAHHHFMVAAARAVAVELAAADLMVEQIAAGRAVGLDRAGRRDVVGGDRIAEHRQRPGAVDVARRDGVHRHAGEVGRVLDVGRPGRPGVGVAAGDLDFPPALVAAIDVGVAAAEHPRMDMGVDQLADFLVRRPDVLEEHRLAVATRCRSAR